MLSQFVIRANEWEKSKICDFLADYYGRSFFSLQNVMTPVSDIFIKNGEYGGWSFGDRKQSWFHPAPVVTVDEGIAYLQKKKSESSQVKPSEKLSVTTLCFWQFFIESREEYNLLKTYLPDHQEGSLLGFVFPRFVYLTQEAQSDYRLISKSQPCEDMKIARVGDIPELIKHGKLVFSDSISSQNQNKSMYYYHCAVTQKTEVKGKEVVKELIPHSVRFAKNAESLRIQLYRELDKEIDIDTVEVLVESVF